ERCPRAVGQDVDGFRDVRAVEQERVEAALAINGIAAITGVPDELVTAGPQKCCVVAAAARDDVVAVTAHQRVGSLTAYNGIVAGTAVYDEPDRPGWQPERIDRVVTGARENR